MKIRLRQTHYHSHQKGYTLIELLLYVSMMGVLLTTVTYFFGTVVSARIKDQTILEVNEQGLSAMNYMTQTIRNATSITSPAIGVTGTSLTVAVSTPALSPTIFSSGGTVLGYSTDGGTTDESNSNVINATKFTASSTGRVSSLYAMIGAVAASPNNKGQMAIYSGASAPTTLLASSSGTTLTGNAWNAFTVTPVNITSGQTYWLAYNTNGLTTADNNLRRHAGAASQSLFVTQTYNAWPVSWTGTAESVEFSMYAVVDSVVPGVLDVKEGTGGAIPLISNRVQMTGLTFKNLSRPSTPGSIQISFVLGRVNPNNMNEYEYQKTFTSTAEVAW